MALPQSGRAEPGIGRSRVRVVVADEHALMRRGLRSLLDAEDGLEVVGEASDLASVVEQVSTLRPQVLVIDLSMSNGSTIDLIRLLRAEATGMEIVVLTMEDSTVFVQVALAGGAVGFVLKQAADAELAQAVRSATRGERYVSPRLRGRLELLRRDLPDA
jgi:two-component system response regulator NreC